MIADWQDLFYPGVAGEALSVVHGWCRGCFVSGAVGVARGKHLLQGSDWHGGGRARAVEEKGEPTPLLGEVRGRAQARSCPVVWGSTTKR